MPRFRRRLLLVAVAALSACNRGPERAPVIGVAYAGPASLALHGDVDLKSPVVATAHHGDRLEIVGRRRSSWYKVRTTTGLEGWAGDRDLLDPAQMARLKKLAEETAQMPSQGVASSFSALNVHTEPNRQAASFVQVAEKEKFDVLARRTAPRVPLPSRQLIQEAPKPTPKSSKKGTKKKSPAESPPATPAQQPAAPAAPAAPPPIDDWTLIRTASGQTGWVLTNNLYLEIPDEVAQYADGHHITSYFSIGKTTEHGEAKDIWMWTTLTHLGEDYDFDSYRVFAWSPRRHHYETAFIQRRERGYLPVLAKPGEFSVCVTKKDGATVRKRYVLFDTSVKAAGESPCAPVVLNIESGPAAPSPVSAPMVPPGQSVRERALAWWKSLRGK